MRGLTIAQPYAYLISLPESRPDHKRVENRTWATSYRGTLAIHAGKSKEWMDEDDFLLRDQLFFGAIVAFADLVDCVTVHAARAGKPFEWLRTHKHVSGPWCWILENIRPLAVPIPCKGAQGLWEFNQTEGLATLEIGAMPPNAASTGAKLAESGLFGGVKA